MRFSTALNKLVQGKYFQRKYWQEHGQKEVIIFYVPDNLWIESHCNLNLITTKEQVIETGMPFGTPCTKFEQLRSYNNKTHSNLSWHPLPGDILQTDWVEVDWTPPLDVWNIPSYKFLYFNGDASIKRIVDKENHHNMIDKWGNTKSKNLTYVEDPPHLKQKNKMKKKIELLHKGKVRDIYDITIPDITPHLLLKTTDRISAFDHVMPVEVIGKGDILNEISKFWFEQTKDIIPNHLSNEISLEEVIPIKNERYFYEKNSMIVKKLNPLPVECIVRGFLMGSGWNEYYSSGSIGGYRLRPRYQLAEELDEVVFTPSTKAPQGEHDENISYAKMEELIGKELALTIKHVSLKIFERASKIYRNCGIILADTKFEFGLDDNNDLYLIDEVCTPDSSRLWDIKDYEVGISPPSLDKQILREWIIDTKWLEHPEEELPEELIEKILKKYKEIKNLLNA